MVYIIHCWYSLILDRWGVHKRCDDSLDVKYHNTLNEKESAYIY